MAIVSTSALRKITVAVLVIAAVSFGAAEIHRRFILPQNPLPTSTETSSRLSQNEPEIIEIMGNADELDEKKITIVKGGKRETYYFSSEMRVFPVYSKEGGEMQISLDDIQAGQPVQAKLIRKEKGKEIYLVKDLFVFF